ncbi:hypothetical protein [Bacillus sp. FJAT-18017]|uniref:hypothetical protein n=1 Tax=Bacillus sp. FJAT-18017 TaxID=1705566 RepID=UPI000AB6E586|nr:hypothetical protein [Bacillus sp. FJAT-18017]
MTNKERIQKAKDDLKEWIEMHDGVVPSEDLAALKKKLRNDSGLSSKQKGSKN